MSLLGGQGRQREVGVQVGPSSGVDDEEREEESAGMNAIEEKKPLQLKERSFLSSSAAISGAINSTI